MQDIQEFYFIRKVRYEGQPRIDNFVKTDATSLDDIVIRFEEFLKGCGFYFKGHLDIIDDEKETEE